MWDCLLFCYVDDDWKPPHHIIIKVLIACCIAEAALSWILCHAEMLKR